VAALTAAGGVAHADDLVPVSSRAALRSAVAGGVTRRLGGGWYALVGWDDPRLGPAAPSRSWATWEEGPDEAEARALTVRSAIARGAKAALSHRCAAAHHGWMILRPPPLLEIAVPPDRHVAATLAGVPCRMRGRALTREERLAGVTSPVRTVLDAARDLPPEEAISIADGALRSGAVGPRELREAGERYRGRGVERVRWATSVADGGAANPFESVLRYRLRDTPLRPIAQYRIDEDGFRARVDLADPVLRIVCEADSYAFHGSADRHAADQVRYAELTVRGWIVLPFGYAAVMNRGAWVAEMATAAAILRGARPGRAA